MSVSLPACPACASIQTVKNGKIHNGKQNFRCRECGRQFVQDPPQNKSIDQASKDLIDKLLLEKIPMAGIARVAGVSEPWLQNYVNAKYQSVTRVVNIEAKKKGHLSKSV
jgi:transposase-like protein